jgi:hypothetical protein
LLRLVLAALLFATSALAQHQAAVASAQEEFLAGQTAFDENDYPLALGHFQRAFALVPSDAVRFNIAVCLERLGRFREAAAEYRAAAQSEELDAQTRERARDLGERARARLGTLVVSADREITVDGEPCAAPCNIELDPGEHRVLAGDVEQIASIERGQTAHVDLVRPRRDPRPPIERGGWHAFGVMTAIGASLAGIGGAGLVGFGIAAIDLRARYDVMRTEDVARQGELMRDLANVSIAVTIGGAAIVLVDLVLLLADPPR